MVESLVWRGLMVGHTVRNFCQAAFTTLGLLLVVGCKPTEPVSDKRPAPRSQKGAIARAARTIGLPGGFKGVSRDPDLPSKVVGQIRFAVRDPANADNGPSPYASIASPAPDIEFMENRHEIVVRDPSIYIVVDYPMEHGWEFKIVATSSAGFTRAGLVAEISKLYHAIYAEEDRSAHTKVVPVDKREGLINRNRTDGTFGIWGHDIGDLVLGEIELHRGGDGRLYAFLVIDS